MSTRSRRVYALSSFVVALSGCTAESTILPCKDGFSLSSEETNAYEATTAKLTIERTSVEPVTYEVSNEGDPKANAEGDYIFRLQEKDRIFNVSTKATSTLVSYGHWEPRAKSDNVDLDLYSCDYGGTIVDKTFPFLPAVSAIQHAACQLDDGTLREAVHRTATGVFQRSFEGHVFLNAKGPSVSLELARFARPAASSVSSDTCVIQP